MGSETVHALRGVSFDIYPGEFVTIMGTSGSGKSTMLNILGCMDKPTAGHYILDGEHTEKLSRDALARIRGQKIGFVFQNYNLLSRTTAIENVELPLLYNSGVSSAERRRRALDALEMVGLADRMNHLPSQLSGGQQQRVAIARALMQKAPIMIFDDSMSAVDTETDAKIRAALEARFGSASILLISHRITTLSKADRILVLENGRIAETGTHEELKNGNGIYAQICRIQSGEASA